MSGVGSIIWSSHTSSQVFASSDSSQRSVFQSAAGDVARVFIGNGARRPNRVLAFRRRTAVVVKAQDAFNEKWRIKKKSGNKNYIISYVLQKRTTCKFSSRQIRQRLQSRDKQLVSSAHVTNTTKKSIMKFHRLGCRQLTHYWRRFPAEVSFWAFPVAATRRW